MTKPTKGTACRNCGCPGADHVWSHAFGRYVCPTAFYDPPEPPSPFNPDGTARPKSAMV